MPAEIIWRKHKFGFESPESRWMQRHSETINNAIAQSELIRSICEPEALGLERLDLLNQGLTWRLYSTAKWAEVFDLTGIELA